MKYIAHRGNLLGPDKDKENNPDYIDEALSHGFDAEIDLWKINDNLFLGHDDPKYKIDVDWLERRSKNLWIHCKNVDALVFMNYRITFNYFWHDSDLAVLTSKGFIWAYPGKQPILNSIAVMPEWHNDDLSLCAGICTDYVMKYVNSKGKE